MKIIRLIVDVLWNDRAARDTFIWTMILFAALFFTAYAFVTAFW